MTLQAKIVAQKAVWGVLALLLTACAGNPPVQTVASLGTQVEQSIDAVLTAAQAAQTAGLISRDQLDRVAIVADKAGRDGRSLANELTQYDSLKAAGGSTTAIVASIQGLIADISSQLGTVGIVVPNGTVQQIDTAVATALSIVASVKAGVL